MSSGFAENLKKIRLEKQMSQEDFAKLLKTSKQNISRYESGAVSPKISTAARFAEILSVSMSELNGDAAAPVSHASDSSVLESFAIPTTLDKKLIAMLSDLSPQEEQIVMGFLAGLKANRTT